MRRRHSARLRVPDGPALVRRDAGLPPIEDHVVEPTRVFENSYFIGFNDVGAWAIETSEGLILIDTLNTPGQFVATSRYHGSG